MKLPVINNRPPEIEMEEFSFQSLYDRIEPVYLDNNATTAIDQSALTEMMKALELDYANPGALHQAGKTAKKLVEDARKNVASFIGCKNDEVVFMGSGSEAINTAIISATSIGHAAYILTCKTEHKATITTAEQMNGYVGYLSVDKEGRFSIDELVAMFEERYRTTCDFSLLSLMIANNETGTIHKNIDKAIELAHKYGALVHLDAVQIAGKKEIKPYIEMGTDYLSISGHKFHASKGVGALYVRTGAPYTALIYGGLQENERRAGTENVPAIVSMGVVAKKYPLFGKKEEQLHRKFIRLLRSRVPSCIINGGDMVGTINVGFQYVHREAMIIKLSQNDVYAGIGSACSLGIKPSHTLEAMNVPPDYIHGSIRFSMSKYTTEQEIDRAVEVIGKVYDELREMGRGIIG